MVRIFQHKGRQIKILALYSAQLLCAHPCVPLATLVNLFSINAQMRLLPR